MKVIIW